MEIDSKLYNDEHTDLHYFNIAIFQSSEIKKNEMIGNFLDRIEKKYKYIYPCDYSKLNFIFDKRKYGIIDTQKKLTFDELEDILLDESLTKMYKDTEKFTSNWLKENFGKGFTGRDASDFKKYVKYHNLEELLLDFKQRKENNFSIEISVSNLKKIEKIVQEDFDLLKNIIFFDKKKSKRYDFEKIFDLLERTNNKTKKNAEEELIKIFYSKVLEDFFKECKALLKENEGYYEHLSKDYKDEKEIQERINEKVRNIEDIYNGDTILEEYFDDIKIIPDEIYEIFRKYETETVKSINERKLETLKELQEKVESEILEFLKNNKIVTIDFSKILESIYPIKSLLREFSQRYIDLQLIEIRYNIMKKIIKDEKKKQGN